MNGRPYSSYKHNSDTNGMKYDMHRVEGDGLVAGIVRSVSESGVYDPTEQFIMAPCIICAYID